MNLFEATSVLNPFSKKFLQLDKEDSSRRQQFIDNAQGKGEEDKPFIGDLSPQDYGYFGAAQSHIAFSQFFEDKATRLSKYREMATYPEISLALDMICDEAVCKNTKNESFTFTINNTSDIKRKDVSNLKKEFDYVVNNLLNFNDMGWELFNKWLVDGEIYLEPVLDKKQKEILGFKTLSPFTMVPIFEGGVITHYHQVDNDKTVEFSPNEMLYVSFGKYGRNRQDVRGFLDNSIKIYNQLRNLEDAVVIYRLVRAPERRLWNIEIGNAPPGKGEEAVRQVMNRYKRNLNYDPNTGMVNSNAHIQALTEDFWFAQRNGQASTVETIGGGNSILGELTDVDFFLKKLYKSLKIPQTRWGADLGGSTPQYTNTQDIEREELNFTKFVERLQNKFKRLVEEAFILNLKIKGYPKELWDPSRYTITMQMSNAFREYRELELIQAKLDLISNYQDLIYSAENPTGKLSNDFFMNYIVSLPGNLAEKNRELLDIEKAKVDQEGGEVSPDMMM